MAWSTTASWSVWGCSNRQFIVWIYLLDGPDEVGHVGVHLGDPDGDAQVDLAGHHDFVDLFAAEVIDIVFQGCFSVLEAITMFPMQNRTSLNTLEALRTMVKLFFLQPPRTAPPTSFGKSLTVSRAKEIEKSFVNKKSS